MRKIIFIISLVILCIISSLFFNQEEKTISVFNEQNNGYNIYLLDVSNNNITTNNIFNYFDDITILEIYPYVNPIYKKLINITSYSFNTALSNKKNVSNFISDYNNKLKENALTTESLILGINGIKIQKVKIYASSTDVNKLINNNSMKLIE